MNCCQTASGRTTIRQALAWAGGLLGLCIASVALKKLNDPGTIAHTMGEAGLWAAVFASITGPWLYTSRSRRC